MSVSASLAQKSNSESEIQGRGNEIRIDEISLPPENDKGNSSAIFDDCQMDDDLPISSALNEDNSQRARSSDSSISNDNDSSVNSEQSHLPLTKYSNLIPQLSLDSQIEPLSQISLPDSSPPSVDNKSYKFSLSSYSNFPAKNDSSPESHMLLAESPPLPPETSPKESFSLTPQIEKENSVLHSPLGASDVFNLTPSTISFTSDIPLPDQDPEFCTPPLPAYDPKIPFSSNFLYTLRSIDQKEGSVKVTKSDYSVEKKLNTSTSLEVDKFDLDNDSCGISDADLERGEAFSNSKDLLSEIELPEGSLSTDLTDNKIIDKIDDSRYSPSRLDSDEENQEFITTKPKVLGKEQAKKRLMAFSLSKQPNTTVVKKQNKLTVPNKVGKEKPPNPNKSAGIQEQFRATISAIEEEKKRMMQNMPNYLYMYRNNLSTVGNTVIPNTAQSMEKPTKDEIIESDPTAKNIMDKDDKDMNKNKFGYASPGKGKGSSQRRSSSRRRSRSRSRRHTNEKEDKCDRKDYDSQLKKMESITNWKSFYESGFVLDSDFRRLKIRFEEKQRRKDRRRSRTPEERSDFRPIFNYLSKKGSKIMTALQAKPSNPGVNITVPFQLKTVKYTRTKPMINWAENPSNATEFYMPKQMLLENCDKTISPILYHIMDQKGNIENELKAPKERYWYPQFNYLVEGRGLYENVESAIMRDRSFLSVKISEEQSERVNSGTGKKESLKEKANKSKLIMESSERGSNCKSDIENSDSKNESMFLSGIESNIDSAPDLRPRERRVSLVNDDYMSDAESDKVPVKEMFVGGVKVQLELGLNRVKVRSKWDSDYEGEEAEREEWTKSGTAQDGENVMPEGRTANPSLPCEERGSDANKAGGLSQTICHSPDFNLKHSYSESNIPVPAVQGSQNADLFEEPKEKLVSEYEEFMKMVAFETGSGKNSKANDVALEKAVADGSNTSGTQSDKINDSLNSAKIETTDWDQESDREEKPVVKKIQYVKDGADDFSLLHTNYDVKKQRKSVSPVKKKSSKSKGSKGKASKKSGKSRKRKYKEMSSSDSSSDSSDSDSDSDSDSESSDSEDEKRKRRKWKLKRKKKRYSSSSDSDSDSDSKTSKAKRSKAKKKKSKSKRNKSSKGSSSSDSEDETQNAMLKQLDFKKQQIIKKIEEIDSIGGKSSRKKDKKEKKKSRKEDRSASGDEEKRVKQEKKKKSRAKSPAKGDRSKGKSKDDEEKTKATRKSDKSERGDESLTESDVNEESSKGKKSKKKWKRRKSSSDSSSDDDHDGDDEKENRKSSKAGKSAKSSKKKKAGYSSSSSSDSGSSRKSKKKLKKKKKKKVEVEKSQKENEQKVLDWNDHLLSDGPDYKTGNSEMNVEDNISWGNQEMQWGRRRKAKAGTGRESKDLGDWEASSREVSPERRSPDSNWDEEIAPSSAVLSKDENVVKSKEGQKGRDFLTKTLIHDENTKFLNDFNLESKQDLLFADNSISHLGQDMSKDVYSSENSTANSLQLFPSLSKGIAGLNEGLAKRNFQGIGIDLGNIGERKSSKEELYSPGHTDSELSDADDKNEEPEKSEKPRTRTKEDIYDPLISDSDLSAEGGKVELNNIPLPQTVTDILLPREVKEEEKETCSKPETGSGAFISGSFTLEKDHTEKKKLDFVALPFASEVEPGSKGGKVSEAAGAFGTPKKKHMISVKLQQQKFQAKVASVFQSDSDEENLIEPPKKAKPAVGESESGPKGNATLHASTLLERVNVERSEKEKKDIGGSLREEDALFKRRDESRIYEKDGSWNVESRSRRKSTGDDGIRDGYAERSERRGSPRRVSPPSERFSTNDAKGTRKNADEYYPPAGERVASGLESRSPRSKIFDEKKVETSSKQCEEVTDAVRPIPVLTGFDVWVNDTMSWDRSQLSEDINYSCDRFDLMDPSHADSYKLYGSQDSKSDPCCMYNIDDKKFTTGMYNRNFEDDVDTANVELDSLLDPRNRKDKRKSRSRSFSPRKRRRSKTPDRRRSPRNRSPRHRSISPRRRGRSPFSPRRRISPRRKSPGRRYRSSRTPERKISRSPRKRRHSPPRRSRSLSPRKRRSPKRRLDSPRRRSISPVKSMSPRKDSIYTVREIGVIRNLIPVIGSTNKEMDMEDGQATGQSPHYDSPMGFTRSLADSTISDSELNNSYYSREFPGEFGSQTYPEEVTVNNLITLQNHEADKSTDSPKRLTLDQRIELELGVPIGVTSGQNDQYQTYQQYPEVHSNQYPNSYSCDNNVQSANGNSNQNFYSNQSVQMNSDFNGQYFNGQQQTSSFGQYHQYTSHSTQPIQNSVLQVGNIMEVVPALQAPPPPPLPSSKGHQIMQVGNVLQVVPASKPTTHIASQGYGLSQSHSSATDPLSPGKTQKGAMAPPTTTMPTPPNPETILNPLIKAIQLEREKRKKEKEKRRAEREARRKARQLRREAKLLSVNEKLKKSVQDEGLMLGQDVEEDELLEEIEHPSPPIPVEIITDSSQNSLPPAGKGILITAGFIPKPSSEKKEVKFADGICPGEGTSPSGGEDPATPPPKPKLPKEKRYKKKKTKLKKKVKVHIIRQVIQDEEEEEEDDLSPPPPPPGDPPTVFFASFPFASKAQYPVYQTQTTTTTLTTVQFPSQSFQ